MKRQILTTIMITVVFISGCAAPKPVPAAESAEPVVPVAKTEVVTETASEVETVKVDYCITCHTDKDALIANAKPVEEVVEENEGVG